MPIYKNEADSFLMVHCGHGDLVVGTAGEADKPFRDELVVYPAKVPGIVGKPIPEDMNGKPTNTLDPGLRVVFDDAASIQVWIDALLNLQSERMAYEASQQE